jgi:glycerate kinase
MSNEKKILLALNSFKGTLSSTQANKALKSGMDQSRFFKLVDIFPLCDGGDGSLEVLQQHLKVLKLRVNTIDAYGDPITGNYLWDSIRRTAYIELAVASGLARIQSQRKNIFKANTIGTGILIKHALTKGARKIILMVGGSATNDAGLGILAALGFRFLDNRKKVVKPTPGLMDRIGDVDTSKSIFPSHVHLEVWTDVNNPFDGSEGAVAIYSKQKGANASDQLLLEKGMIRFRKMIFEKYGIDLNTIQGTGAAGGVGGGLIPFLNASIKHGTQEILRLTHFSDALKSYHVVITGEGSLDIQSAYGKLVQGVIQEAKRIPLPVIGICGSNFLNPSEARKIGFEAVFSLVPGPISLAEAMKDTKRYLTSLGYNISGLVKACAA